jgi:hypothetical protein
MARPRDHVRHTICLPPHIFPGSQIEIECLTSIPHSICPGNRKETHEQALIKDPIFIYI